MSHRTPNEITGWSLLIAWLEVLPAVAATLSTALLLSTIGNWVAAGWVTMLAATSLIIAILLIMYATTRSPRPVVLRLCVYGCAAAATIAILSTL